MRPQLIVLSHECIHLHLLPLQRASCRTRRFAFQLAGAESFAEGLAWLRKPNLLLLDEVGHEPLSPEQAHVFFQLINVRYETGSIVMTSNRPFSKWAELMSDEAVATAMLDRLLHHVQVFSLKADSYRMKERLRVGAVGFD
jgi:DNA replication protein DnaC